MPEPGLVTLPVFSSTCGAPVVVLSWVMWPVAVWSECERITRLSEIQSITANKTPETTKVRWMITRQMVPWPTSAWGSADSSMKSFNSSITEIATNEPINLIFRPLKSIVPIQCGRSLDSVATSIRETKFSYPAKITIKIKLANKVRSSSANRSKVNVWALALPTFSKIWINSMMNRYCFRQK
mgnify:CR=1 FL=1